MKLGCWPKPEVAQNINKHDLGKLKLSETEVDDIIAFLQTLTDGYWTNKIRISSHKTTTMNAN